MFSQIEPTSVHYDMGIEEYGHEGRIITLEYPNFYLINVYTPNARGDLSRLDYRVAWDKAFPIFSMSKNLCNAVCKIAVQTESEY